MADKRTIEEWADDKPEYEVTEQHSVACTCEYRPSRKCPIHGRSVPIGEGGVTSPFSSDLCICRWEPVAGGLTAAKLRRHTHPYCPIHGIDWNQFEEGYSPSFASLCQAILWLKARVEALEK